MIPSSELELRDRAGLLVSGFELVGRLREQLTVLQQLSADVDDDEFAYAILRVEVALLAAATRVMALRKAIGSSCACSPADPCLPCQLRDRVTA